MNKKIRFGLLALLLTSLFGIIGCSEDVYENHAHDSNRKNPNEVSFRQFINETKLKKFESFKSANLKGATGRDIQSEFIIDTTKILKYQGKADLSGITTFSFRVYPLNEQLAPNVYYNFVYDKKGDEWNELIFKNTINSNTEPWEENYLSSQLIYNKFEEQSRIEICSNTFTYVECDGSCAEHGYATCDGYNCTGIDSKCWHQEIQYYTCGTNPFDYELVAGPSTGTGGGANYSGIYWPNPYDGDPDLSNPDDVFTANVYAFLNSSDISQNSKTILSQNPWMSDNIVDWMKANGGLTDSNKDSAAFAISRFLTFQQYLNVNSWTIILQANKFKSLGFRYLLDNPNTESVSFINQVGFVVDNNYINQAVEQDYITDFIISTLEGDNNVFPDGTETIPPDCASFNFTSTGSNWQEAAVQNINFSVTILSPQGVYVSYVVDEPQAVLFGCPKVLSVGNTFISPGNAASSSAVALKQSMNETVRKYGAKPVTALMVQLDFESRLKRIYPLHIPGGRVQIHPQTYSVVPTQYQTTAFGTGNCGD